jgi:transposase InsO family protein
MDTVEAVEKSEAEKKYPKRSKRYGVDFKLQIVKKLIEESVPASVIQQECGVSGESIGRWVRDYQKFGEAGLATHRTGKGRRLPAPVRQKIIEIREANPFFGITRISQLLRRAFFLSASPETVRKTLRDSSLASPPHKKLQRNITRPRFFERSTPNQLWQTDIFTFRLGGHYAYLIGYIDDYSRYITGLDLFRSQTGQSVIEVYRRAASEYNPPKEMLTDNGRQYTSWRGNTRFEGEMKKDKIHHIKSRPHHPMTLGKIERFWKTIYLEFLSRAQFASFEDAGDRIRQWVKYYNHKRPHQGIGGLCPADRYFEIQSELKKTIEQGIQENLLEMALRGKPKLPFYMVGRMEGQSVVLRAEKGKLRLSVDDEDDVTQEVVYNLDDKGDTHGQDQDRAEENHAELRSHGEMPGSALDLDRAAETLGDLPGDAGAVDGAGPVAEACHGGDAAGLGTESEPGQGTVPVSPAPDDAGEETAVASGQQQAGKDPVQSPGSKERGPLPVKGPETVSRTPQDGETVA